MSVGSPYLDISMESRTYYGQDTIICWNTGSIDMSYGYRYVICAIVQPKDASGNPTNFSSSNTFRFTIKNGCGAIVSDVTHYNVGTGGTDPLVLSGEGIGTPIPSGIVNAGWGGPCATGWNISLTFNGSTLDGTPVATTAVAIADTTPIPPPPPLAPEQTTGDPGPHHAGQGDPVDSLTGAFNYHPDRTDLAYSAKGGPLAFGRSYASDTVRSNRFGPGWSDSFDAALTVDPATGNVSYHDPRGPIHVFTRAGSAYVPPLGADSTLTSTATGWSLLFKDQVTYKFDLNCQLTAMLDRNSQGTSLTWNGGKLVAASASGRELAFAYNEAGLVREIRGSDSRTVSYEYGPDQKLQKFVDASGLTTTYGYDSNSLLSSVQDPNGNFPVRNTYDPSSRRVSQQLDSDSQITTFGWTQAGPDPRTGAATVTDPRGNTLTDSYEQGYLVAQTDADGNVSHFAWNREARLAVYGDRLGHSTYFRYDEAGNLTRREGPDGKAESYRYNSRNDIIEGTDFNGKTSTLTYDSNGNLATVSRASITGGTSPVIAMRYTYNGDGTLQSATDALARTTQYGYNPSGDLISTTSPEGRKATVAVDSAGRTTSSVEVRGNVAGNNPDTYRTSMTWDALDRVTKTVNPLGHATSTAYDPGGRVDHQLDAKGGRTTYAYGTSSNPLAIQGPDPAVGPHRFTYDANGNVATSTSPAGVTTSFTYTSSNARKSVTSTGTGTWTYNYDKAGRISVVTAPSSKSVTLSRTPQGQVSRMTYSDGTPSVRYTYDAAGNRVSMSDFRGTTTYSYNAANLMTSSTVNGTSFTFTHDEAGQVTSRKIPDGGAASQYAYDHDGRLTGVMSGLTTLASYAYDNATGAVTTNLQGGVSNTLMLDPARRPLSVEGKKGSLTLTRSQYLLDELGNPTKVTNADGTADSYAYSPQSRLTAACYNAPTCSADATTAAFRYTYDGDGNITSVIQPTGTTAYSYDSAGRLTGRSGLKGAATYLYDADGNTTSDGTGTYSWNAAGQLKSVTAGNTSTSYSYDGNNHRVGTTVGRTSTTQTYDPLIGALVLEQSGTKNIRKYDYGIGLLSVTAGSATSSYLTDALGSVRGVASSAGALTHGYSYNPYGDTRATTSAKNAPENPLQFTGAYRSSSLHQMGARDYRATDGRFLSPDPAGIPGRGYSYAAANPMANIDPSGLSEYDWREMVNRLADGIAGVSGTVAIACTIAFIICGQIAPVAGALSWAASAVAVATSEQTTSCLSGRASCPEAIVGAAMAAGAGKFGLGGQVGKGVARQIDVDSAKYGSAAAHMRETCGSSFCVTYDPAGAKARRVQNMQRSGLPPRSDADRDESPMAVFKESESASVRYVEIGHNRSLGQYISRQLRGLNPGDVVRINVK